MYGRILYTLFNLVSCLYYTSLSLIIITGVLRLLTTKLKKFCKLIINKVHHKIRKNLLLNQNIPSVCQGRSTPHTRGVLNFAADPLDKVQCFATMQENLVSSP